MKFRSEAERGAWIAFAAGAIAGLEAYANADGDGCPQDVAVQRATEQADALLEALREREASKGQSPPAEGSS